MSLIGKKPIAVPKGVKITVSGDSVLVEGPKGKLTHPVMPGIAVNVEPERIDVKRGDERKQTIAFHGLMRAKLNNMVVGVSTGFTKELELIGVGYRADLQGTTLNFSLGYSHPVKFAVPAGVSASVDKQTKIVLTSADKELLGQTAANIVKLRPPEVYKGKGVRYAGQVIKLKPGKTAGKK